MSMLPSHKFHEPGQEQEEDQRPLARYLRYLQRTDPVEYWKAVMDTKGSMRIAYLKPFLWMCHMEVNNKYGRHMVADGYIPKETTIGFDYPIVYVTREKDRCDECDRRLNVGGFTSVRCNHHGESCPLHFCSEECRDWAWEHYHKVQDPQVMQENYENNHGRKVFVAVLFSLKVFSMMQLPEANFHALSYITAFLQNPHLLEKAKASAGQQDQLLEIFDVAVKKKNVKCNSELLGKLFWLKQLYSFGSVDCCYLYGPSSFFNHSCEGNVTVGGLRGDQFTEEVGGKPFGTIEAIRPIQKGEQLCFDYRKTSMTPRSTRKANLKAQYGFDCHCRLCNDGIPRCDHDGCRAENDSLKRCSKCQNAVYCNRACQIKDWKHHKQYCGLKAAGACL